MTAFALLAVPNHSQKTSPLTLGRFAVILSNPIPG
jgi:hypothetical protein